MTTRSSVVERQVGTVRSRSRSSEQAIADVMIRAVSSAAEAIRVLRPKTDEKGGCSAPPPFDPVSIPHDIEKRGVTTGTDPEPDPQVNGLFVPPLHVSGSAGLNLSRWRHGFKSRWDYDENRRSRA